MIEHLVLGYRLTSETLETRLAKRRLSSHRKRTYVEWSLQLMILSFGTMPRVCLRWRRRSRRGSLPS